jgi:nicotinamide-nucleotide amidase
LLTRLKDVYVATGDSGQASPTAASVLNLITNGARDRIVPAREFRPGAAERRHGSFVTYTKANKIRALGVPKSLLAEQGAVCRDVAAAMATGALTHSPADVAVSIGVAGPDPDEDGNPVGRVCIGVGRAGTLRAFEFNYGNLGREEVQARAMADALAHLIASLEAA